MADYKPEILRTRVRGGILVIIDNALRQYANQRVILPYHNGITAETVVLLVRKISTKDYVTVEVRPEELELGSLKTHGTYEEIKSYVLKKHGLKVSTLNISQVKRKCGLDVGEAYNKPKKQNSKVPNCPPEKETAIMDDLKHFNMI